MNKKIQKLAKQAGFVFWGNEEWGPGSASIDWCTDYSKEFDKFSMLLIEECAKVVRGDTSAEAVYGGDYHAKKIEEHFSK